MINIYKNNLLILQNIERNTLLAIDNKDLAIYIDLLDKAS